MCSFVLVNARMHAPTHKILMAFCTERKKTHGYLLTNKKCRNNKKKNKKKWRKKIWGKSHKDERSEICWKTASWYIHQKQKRQQAAPISHKTFNPPPITLNRQKKFVDFLIIDFEPIPLPLRSFILLYFFFFFFSRLFLIYLLIFISDYRMMIMIIKYESYLNELVWIREHEKGECVWFVAVYEHSFDPPLWIYIWSLLYT